MSGILKLLDLGEKSLLQQDASSVSVSSYYLEFKT